MTDQRPGILAGIQASRTIADLDAWMLHCRGDGILDTLSEAERGEVARVAAERRRAIEAEGKRR